MTSGSDTGMKQATLDGDEAERVECEYYDGCESPALYIAEILHYGEGEKPVKMCESCADELTEPEHPDESKKARRLDAVGRWDVAG